MFLYLVGQYIGMHQTMRFLHSNRGNGGYYHSGNKRNIQSRQLKRYDPLVNKLMKRDARYKSFIEMLDILTEQLNLGKENSAKETALAMYAGGYGRLLCDPDAKSWLGKIHKLLVGHANAKWAAEPLMAMLLESGHIEVVREIIVSQRTEFCVREKGFLLLRAGGYQQTIDQALEHPQLSKTAKVWIMVILAQDASGTMAKSI